MKGQQLLCQLASSFQSSQPPHVIEVPNHVIEVPNHVIDVPNRVHLRSEMYSPDHVNGDVSLDAALTVVVQAFRSLNVSVVHTLRSEYFTLLYYKNNFVFSGVICASCFKYIFIV